MTGSVRLGDVLDIQNGYAFKSADFSDTNGVPLIRIRDLLNDHTETMYKGEYRPEFMVRSGDMLIGMDGDFQCVKWKGPDGLLNQRVCRLHNFAPSIDPDFVYFSIAQKLEDIHRTTAFVTVKHISSKQISNIEIPNPSLREQRRIADILTRANSILRLRRQAQEKARQIVPALFAKMFGDPARNSKVWPNPPIGDGLLSADYGTSAKSSQEDHGLPVLRMGNVTYQGDLDVSDLKYVELPESEVEKCRLEEGDLIFNRTNSKELVGKTGLWDGRFPVVAASYFIRLRTDGSRLAPHYLWAFMNSQHMKRRLRETARGAIGQSNINARELKAFPIPLPPLDLQQMFAAHVSDIHSIIDQQSRMAAANERLVDSLMHRMFERA